MHISNYNLQRQKVNQQSMHKQHVPFIIHDFKDTVNLQQHEKYKDSFHGRQNDAQGQQRRK